MPIRRAIHRARAARRAVACKHRHPPQYHRNFAIRQHELAVAIGWCPLAFRIDSFSELRSRLDMCFVRSTAASAAAGAAKFVRMNYLILSQMAMVIAGLASSGSTSSPTIDAASVAIGVIPLIISSVLLLHVAMKIVQILRRLNWKKLFQRPPNKLQGSDRKRIYTL
jgi:hypothetical protein